MGAGAIPEAGRAWAGFPGAPLQLAAAAVSSASSQSGSAAEPSLPPALVTGFAALNGPCLSAAHQPAGASRGAGGKGTKPVPLGGCRSPAQAPGTARRGDARGASGSVGHIPALCKPFLPPTQCPEPLGSSRKGPGSSCLRPRAGVKAQGHRRPPWHPPTA